VKLIPELKSNVIESIAHGAFGTRLWNDVIMFISDLDNRNDLSNADKHAKVKKDLRVIFGDVFECILDAAISIGVMWLRSNATR